MTAQLELDRSELERLYTTAQLARILDLPESTLRSWIRHELIQPARVVGRLAFFDFRQLAGAKVLARLAAGGITAARLRKHLSELEGWWPEKELALCRLDALEEGGRLLVRTREGMLAESNGQLVLDFGGLDAGAQEADEPAGAPLDYWFRRGLQLEEEGRDEEALLAYTKALGFGKPPAELLFNLGNLLFRIERKEEARQCFALATEIDSEYLEAWNNLGNALAATERREEAVAAYARALAIAPDYADAHFNLAETLAELGRTAEAREHWQAYLEQDPHSPWADEVRARLRRTE